MLHAFLLGAAAQLPCDRDPAPTKMAQPVLPAGFHVPGNATRTATVAVTLDDAGKLTAVSIYKSSGNAVMDEAARDAAKRSTFTPGAANCTPTGGTFATDFSFDGYDRMAAACPANASLVRAHLPDTSGLRIPYGSTVPVSVLATISANGTPVDARIVQSSGVVEIDRAALDTARYSTFQPAMFAVRRQASTGTAANGIQCVPLMSQLVLLATFERKSNTIDETLSAAPSPQPCFRDVTVQKAVSPAYPDSARAFGLLPKQVHVRVDVAADGSVRSANAAKSSGNDALDGAAVAAATKSTYLPKIVNCKAVEGSYDYVVTFDPN